MLTGNGLKAGLALLGLFLLAFSYYYTFNKGYDLAILKVQNETSKAALDAAEKARAGAAKAGKQLEGDTDAILKSNDDGPLAGVLRDQLDRMRHASH